MLAKRPFCRLLPRPVALNGRRPQAAVIIPWSIEGIRKLTEKFVISPDVVAKQLGEETVILHLGTGTYFGLDPVGARIWQLLSEGKSVAEICDVMLEEFDVSRDDLERDIAALIQYLLAQNLISTP